MSTKANIIIIEDERNICSFISRVLEPEGYRVITAATGREGLQHITSDHPDLILLDLGLPDMDGLKLIESVRSWSTTPIIVISARTMETSKVEALDMGADDYLTKPFGTGELLARIRTALRHAQRGQTHSASRYEVGELSIDFERRLVKVKGREVHLTQIEYKLVCLLAQNAGRVMTMNPLSLKSGAPMRTATIRSSASIWHTSAGSWRKIPQNPSTYLLKSASATGCVRNDPGTGGHHGRTRSFSDAKKPAYDFLGRFFLFFLLSSLFWISCSSSSSPASLMVFTP